MQVTIQRAALSGELKAIASKSHAHRLLICAALSQQPSKVLCSETSQDIEATADCLNALGAQIRREMIIFRWCLFGKRCRRNENCIVGKVVLRCAFYCLLPVL